MGTGSRWGNVIHTTKTDSYATSSHVVIGGADDIKTKWAGPQAVNASESGYARQTSALYLNYGAASVAQRLSRIIELTLVPSRVSSVEP